MASLSTSRARNFGPVLRLAAVTRKVTLLVAVTTGDEFRIARLVTIFSQVVLRTTIATSTWSLSFDVWTLMELVLDAFIVRRPSYITGEVASLIAFATFDVLGRTWLGTYQEGMISLTRPEMEQSKLTIFANVTTLAVRKC